MTTAMLVATAASGLFAGAAVYVTAVEHPARLECGSALAIREFGPSYRRGAMMQGGLAAVAFLGGVVAWLQGAGVGWLAGAILLGVLIPYTLVVIMPTNRRLLDPKLDSASGEARELLARWARLHMLRTVVGVAVFVAFAGLMLR
jgi:hypothetical protein